jgi:hypothetical protein
MPRGRSSEMLRPFLEDSLRLFVGDAVDERESIQNRACTKTAKTIVNH